ncbi:delta-lactam-biosynthetic de-N-acetylase [Ornithinibacillus bavariensis]|uniref:Delta-lactam-biosynthetic de-N-acetylase n=1 Tax=Ornithinibacillus bavariensis TaxID=545502 RepID=A0A919X958_9BACI|nr:delta-lactam-biosynthetic de-N-acetylase [Ornithinibacillus bavariensis]GIO27871.1 delta-lactam-biosynthetic de-N-acetylase [Ornithinibacillus bavariensis]HAM80352.1 delta-lactam-biosynthetic de-N-acetylase [Ornithinibacillus sp.]
MFRINRLRPTAFVFFLAFFFVNIHGTEAAGYGWGYKKNKDHEIPDVGRYGEILKEYGAYYVDDSGEKTLYLTFDNGYEQGYTEGILDVLKKEKVPATFFVTGHYVNSQPELIKRMVDEGHIIGNHSYHHPDFTILTKEVMKRELETLEEAVRKVSSQDDIKYVRPPKGMFNQQTLEWANELGYIHVFWSLAIIDWNTNAQKGWQYAYDQVMEQVHPGAIILLHAVSEDNAMAMEKMLQDLKKNGYTFKSLDEFVIKDKVPKGIYGF